MVTFLRLFTNRKSFQSRSRSLGRENRQLGSWARALPTACSLKHRHAYSLHEFLGSVLQVLGQVWSSPAGCSGQEAEPVDGTQLSLQLSTELEQPGQRYRGKDTQSP